MTEPGADMIAALSGSLELTFPKKISHAALKEKIAVYINELIGNNFQKLVSVLYRVDISESKLKTLLKENPGADAGAIIADLIIERQLQKIKSRRQFSQRDNNIDENEKW